MLDPASHSSSSTWLSYGLGAITGIALGLLLAPSRGDDLRRRFSRGFRKTADSARNLTAKLTRTGRRMLDAASGKTRRAASTLSVIAAGAENRRAPRSADELP